MDAIVVGCRSCGTKNRKDPLRPGEPVCARCGKALPAGGGPVALDDRTFGAALEAARVPVLVDFWAEWCGPCRVFAPVLERFAAEHPDELLVAKVDTEHSPLTARRLGITAIPTAIVFRGAVELARQAGAMPLDSLSHWVFGTVGAERRAGG